MSETQTTSHNASLIDAWVDGFLCGKHSEPCEPPVIFSPAAQEQWRAGWAESQKRPVAV